MPGFAGSRRYTATVAAGRAATVAALRALADQLDRLAMNDAARSSCCLNRYLTTCTARARSLSNAHPSATGSRAPGPRSAHKAASRLQVVEQLRRLRLRDAE
jgi:hypothetical protein